MSISTLNLADIKDREIELAQQILNQHSPEASLQELYAMTRAIAWVLKSQTDGEWIKHAEALAPIMEGVSTALGSPRAVTDARVKIMSGVSLMPLPTEKPPFDG